VIVDNVKGDDAFILRGDDDEKMLLKDSPFLDREEPKSRDLAPGKLALDLEPSVSSRSQRPLFYLSCPSMCDRTPNIDHGKGARLPARVLWFIGFVLYPS
jgi:hypothetical protein